MDRAQLESTFDRQAESYDQQWARLAAFRDGIHLLLASLFAGLPQGARLLCVGAGTGAEVHFLASQFPTWRFVAVEPSAGMVGAGQRRAEQHGYADRCTFHNGYLDSLPDSGLFDGATCLLVSQFILDPGERSMLFAAIAGRLKSGGILASSDLASDVQSERYQSLLEVWLRTMAAANLSPERVQQMRDAYARDVSILPPKTVEAIIASGGFESPVQFYQAGLIHAWFCRSRPR